MPTARAAEYLGVSVATLRSWRAQALAGETPKGPTGFRLGARRVVYKRADLDAWIEAPYRRELAGVRA